MVLTLAVLASLALTAHGQPAGEKPDKECCDTKTVGGVTYSLVGQMDTKMYNCLSDCIYMKEGQEGSKFCFAMGDLQVECNDEEMEGSEKPPMEGSEKPPMEGSEKPPMEGSEKPPMEEGSSPAPGSSSGGSGSWENYDYCSADAEHTMCVYQGPSSVCSAKTNERGLTAAARDAIVEAHNEQRRKVAGGNETHGPQPAASNMKKLVWNEEIAAIAQRWADQCTFDHDKVRDKEDGTWVGQNAYERASNQMKDKETLMNEVANEATLAWYNEVEFPGFNSAHVNPFQFDAAAGHYTQVVWADTEEIGCGFTYYEEPVGPPIMNFVAHKSLTICNYAKGGNAQNKPMYLIGEACSACPEGYSCKDGDVLCSK